MIDWQKITGFDWDLGNALKSVTKHGVSRMEAEEVFFNAPLIIVQDNQHSQNENRFHALGKSNTGRLIHVTFTLRNKGQHIRVISARDMSKKERAIYDQEI